MDIELWELLSLCVSRSSVTLFQVLYVFLAGSKQTMDMLTATDVSRMILSIEHESSSKIKEVKLEAIREYNLIKDRVVSERRQLLAGEFARRRAELEQTRRQAESCLRKEYKIKKERLKAKVLDAVFRKAEDALRTQQMDKGIVEDVLAKVRATEVYVFCNEESVDMISKIAKDIRYEVKPLPAEGIGGVIVCTKDGKEVWDNCFKTRLQMVRDKHLDILNKALFAQ